MLKKVTLLLVGVLLLVADLYGQNKPLSSYRLDSLVVTATRTPVNQRKAGRQITVYNTAEIKYQPAQTVAELLRTLGGVIVQSRGGFGVQSDYTIRGSSFKGVLILIDGVPINGPQAAHYLTDFPVPLSAIARIEVLRGSASALYGANAIGGVINIFTHAGLRTLQTPETNLEGGLHAKYGSHQLYDMGGSVRQSFGATTLYAATTMQGTDGETIFNDAGERVVGPNGPLSTDFTRQTHTLAVTHAFDDAMLYARAGMDRRDLNAYHYYTDFDSDRGRANNRTYWMQARLRNDISEKTNWSIQLAGKKHGGKYVYNPESTGSRDKAGKINAQAIINHNFSTDFTLSGGISGEFKDLNSITDGEHNQFTGGIYTAANWQPFNRFTVNLSNRINYDTGYGVEVTPQMSLAYNIHKFTFRASGGRAVRAPTFTELYIKTEEQDPSGNLGNPDLEAERAWSAEAGIDYYVASGISLYSTVFYRDVSNVIDWTQLPGQELYVARNLLSAQVQGIEFGLNASKAFSKSTLSLNLFYTFLDKEIDETNEEADYKYGVKGARQLIQGDLVYQYQALSLALRGVWKDRRSKKSYSVIHTRAAYRLPFADERLSISIAVRNIFDTEFADIFDAPMPGRWWIGGLNVAL